MDPDELIERFPRVFHVTEAGAWASIRHHGLLSTSALRDLFEVEDPLRSRIETQPRPDSVVLEHPAAGRAVIRDNRPLRLDVLGRCLDGTVADWCRLLNARVLLGERASPAQPPGRRRQPNRGSVRVLVLAPGARLLGLCLRRAVEQEAVVRGDERVRRHHGVGVVDGPVLARERDPARAFTQAVL
jgi:hypothetical protein